MTLKTTLSAGAIIQSVVSLFLAFMVWTANDVISQVRVKAEGHDKVDTDLQQRVSRIEGNVEAKFDEIYRLFASIDKRLGNEGAARPGR